MYALDRDLTKLNVRDFLEAAAHDAPDKPFLMYGDEVVSYAEFNRGVDLAASAWYGLGIRTGDRVAFMLENRPDFVQAWLGLAKIGAILVAINTRLQAEEVAYFLDLTEPRFALIGADYRDVFHAASRKTAGLERIFALGADERFADFHDLLDGAQPRAPGVELNSNDVISFISTSGTTGRPKAVMQTHGNYVLTGEGYASWIDFQRGERIYVCLPLFHINSQAYSLMGAIAARATVVLVERFSASGFWPDMARYRVSVFNYIGSMLAVLMKREPSPEERSHAVRLTYGGPALPGPMREEVERRFGLTLISGIGMSETTYGLIESIHGERRPGSLGKPRQHPDPRIVNEARVIDDEGNEAAPDAVGELAFRNPVMMKGYYRSPEQTAETIRGGWLFTGDLVRRDADGFFYFVDRKKDIIRVRGENVASAEVEVNLSEHPAVQEAAVVGVPSELTDEDIAAFVVAQQGQRPPPEELTAWLRERLASFKVPRYLWLVESLPKTETLRVEKHRLRELARQRLAESEQREARLSS